METASKLPFGGPNQQPGVRIEGESDAPYWRRLSLAEMSAEQWESLCDGCGRCCLNKLEDWDTGDIFWTDVVCRLFDDETCSCNDYSNRTTRVPDCQPLTPDNVLQLKWLPPTCAYKLIGEGRELYWWHPLVSGDADTVHFAGISVRGRTVSENDVSTEDLEDHVVDWPGETPGADREAVSAVAEGD
ncbi:MAG: YcgN family cysteine cluster protein [Hyphomicrobiales bacterium]|nr:YcgN family cysteine cluster protein [Hyphomicrobiales bacterium]